MRIIELRLKNLNSLKGEWHIDFSDKAFIDEGIFAITGQTGAGKTTILDAICLALYGETPRISNISKSTNEVMTRRMGDCFAEVVIDIDGVQYRCHWSQRRAHGKADGKLQDATHEISYANSQDTFKAGDLIEHKSSLTKKKIVELTRMDFQQFTRSILLAQGSFSAFLKAKSDERADILEKITGTDIYATISQRTFEKMREKEGKLAELEATLKGLSLLSSEDEAQLKTDAQNLAKDLSQYRLDITSLDKKIKWCDDISELTQQLAEFQQALAQSKQQQADFTADAERLDNANKALEIEGIYNQLQSKREAHRLLTSDLNTINEQLPIVKEQITAHSEQLSEAQKVEQDASHKLQQALPIIAKTREIDAQIAQHQSSFEQNNTQNTKLNKALTTLNEQINHYQNAKTSKEQQLETLKQYLSTNSHHEHLAKDIINLDSVCVQLKQTLLDNHQTFENKKSKLKEQNNQDTHLNTLKKDQTDIETQLKQYQDQLTTLSQKQQDLLQGQSLVNLRQQQEQSDDATGLLQQLINQFESIEKLRATIESNQQQTVKLKAKTTDAQQLINECEQKLTNLKSQRKDKQLNLQQQQQIMQLEAKLEDYIDLLESNKPCPLCGSTHHPYVDDIELDSELDEDTTRQRPNSKSNSEHQTLLAEINSQIKAIEEQTEQFENQLSQYKITLATTEHDINQKQKQFNDLINQLDSTVNQADELISGHKNDYQHYTASVKNILQQHKVLTFTESLVSKLADLVPFNLDNTQQAIDLIAETLNPTIESIQITIEGLISYKQQIKQAVDNNEALALQIKQIEENAKDLESKCQSIIIETNNTKNNLQYITKEMQEADNQITKNNDSISDNIQQLHELIAKYKPIQSHVDDQTNTTDHWLHNATNATEALDKLQASTNTKQPLTPDQNEPMLESLRGLRSWMKQLRDSYQSKSKLKQQASSQLDTLAVQINDKTHQISETNEDIKQLSATIETQSKHLIQLGQQRSSLFGEKDLQTEENKLRSELDKAKETLTSIKDKHTATEYKLKQLTENKTQKQQQLIGLTSELSQQETDFASKLAEQQFIHEQAFIEARLPKHERDQLSAQKQHIAQSLQFAQSSVATTEVKLKEKQDNPLTTEDKSVLKNQRDEKQALIDELMAQLGAISQQLKTNEERKGHQQSQLEAIAQQKQDLKVWQQLNELIGSATGKKFRTFAQGLTFEIMVTNANAQLQKMSDRYLLIRDDDSPLELNVIDNYQGGLQRSTKNLSGGEGFIISLALALGLSNMASHNIRVDSLFLDEGFGTLDDDSLDIALNTLTSLQQEGKLIGVISHVQVLKERIHTQIRVDKLSGGHSQISGPGCSKIIK